MGYSGFSSQASSIQVNLAFAIGFDRGLGKTAPICILRHSQRDRFILGIDQAPRTVHLVVGNDGFCNTVVFQIIQIIRRDHIQKHVQLLYLILRDLIT